MPRLRLFLAAALFLSACGPGAAPAAPPSPPAQPTAAPAKPAATTAPAAAAPTSAPAAAAKPTAAPQPTAAPGQPKRGGILKVGLQADPTSLDPQKTSLTALFHVTEHIYSLLVRLKPDLTIEPDLAEKWDISPDGMTYTFSLRKGVKFHSGKPLTSADVKYTFDRLVDKATASPNASLLSSVDSVTTPDDGTVKITLKKADASFLTNLTSPAAVIINQEAVTKNGDLTK